MKDEQVIVGIAEGRVAVSPQILVTYALGSCVGICLFDSVKRVAGMAHILLPNRALSLEQRNPYKFADSGIESLLAAMEREGARRSRISAKIAGGARMFQTNGSSEGIGEKNIRAVKVSLKQLGIRIVAEDTGENYGRTVYFYSETGMLKISSVKQKEQWV